MLKPRHRTFADIYLDTNNPRQSYVDAGYTDGRSSSDGACRLLKRKDVQAYFKKILDKRNSRHIASREEVLETLTRAMREELDEEVVVQYRDSYEIVRRKVAIKERIKSAEMLAKRYGLLTEKIQLSAGANTNFIAMWSDGDDDEDTSP